MTEPEHDTPQKPVEYCPDYSLGAKDAERLRETEKALRARPHVSLRLRIVTGFLLCFFLTGATALVTLTVLYQARSKLRFLESSQAVMREIEQARHYERDFFLNGSRRNRSFSASLWWSD